MEAASVAETGKPKESSQSPLSQLVKSGDHTLLSQHVLNGDGIPECSPVLGYSGMQIDQVNAIPLKTLQAGLYGSIHSKGYVFYLGVTYSLLV